MKCNLPNGNSKLGQMGHEFQMRNVSNELDVRIGIAILIHSTDSKHLIGKYFMK